jgi:tetratricopeptide (TPR) repeat protein
MLSCNMFLLRLSLISLITTLFSLAQSASEWKTKADALESAGKTQQALETYQKAEGLDPKNAAILIKIAKQYGDLMPALKGDARKQAAQKSLAYSRKAVALAPKLSDSHLALALSLGKNTEFLGNREKLEASREIKSAAETALKLNPKSDYAHHMLGRWHQEIAAIGGGTRMLAKVVYGGIPNGSYEEALDHFEKARNINSKRLIHHIEYGRTLAMMGRDADARTELKKALAMPNQEADDPESKLRGQSTLKKL